MLTVRGARVVDLAVQIHGAPGDMHEVPVERIYRNVRLLRLYLVKAAQRKQ